VAIVSGREPAYEQFDHEVKKKRGKEVALEGAPYDPHGCGVPVGVANSVDAPLFRFETRRVKSLGSPKNSSTRTSCSWFVAGNALLKSR